MKKPDYPPPVDRLLALGETEDKYEDWLDYVSLGLAKSHAAELIRMASDLDLLTFNPEEDEDDDLIWAPMHAARALGQFHVAEAVKPLIDTMNSVCLKYKYWEDDDIPIIFRLIGAPAVAPLSEYLADASRPMLARAAAANSLEEIGNYLPEPRPDCIAALTEQLRRFRENTPQLNACLVWTLIELYADESLPVIQAAYRAKRVDLEECPWRKVTEEFELP